MGRVSKIRELDLERQVIELRQRGFGPVTIANKLNEEYKLEGPNKIIFSNVVNFLKSIPKTTQNLIKQEHIEEILIEPARQLKQDLAELRGPLFEKAKAILTKDTNQTSMSKDDIKSLEIYMRHYEQVWDRVAKIESIIKPEEAIKARNIYILQQYNDIKELVNEVIISCPSCKEKFIQRLQTTVDANETLQ